jgi:hypothetical protein
MMRIIHSMSFSLSDRKLKISFLKSNQFDADIPLQNQETNNGMNMHFLFKCCTECSKIINLNNFTETHDLITIEQRIKRCKDDYPDYDYDSLNDEEKDVIFFIFNSSNFKAFQIS